MDEDALLSLGLWIKRRRKALDLTQEALAVLVGCSKNLIIKIEGDARRPSRQVAVLLAEHLQLACEERADFIRCARAELAVDRLPAPAGSVPRVAFRRDANLHPPAEPAPRLPAALPKQRMLAAQSDNLPAQRTPLVGRERELAAIVAMLRQETVRLVTLTGPGGIGKTRLALQVAADLVDVYPDGVWFVDLSPISDPRLVVATIAQTLGVATSNRPVDQLKAALRHKHMLLAVDNYEQVIDAAPLVAELLAGAARLKALVTSRVALKLYGEHEYAVPPLALPERNRLLAVERLNTYAAVALFIQRARAARADFTVTNANAPAIAEICHRLDGLPLAIELAAARVKLFPPEALLGRLVHYGGLGMLTGGPRDLPARQQTIRNTLNWSYGLLRSDERALFRQLGVFVGGFTCEAAEAVCTDPMVADDGSSSLLNRLTTLLDHSLLIVLQPIAAEPRYGMLETLREYAIEQLRVTGEEAEVRRRHAAWYARWVVDIQRTAAIGAAATAERITGELGNIRSALDWSFTRSNADVLYGLQLFGDAWNFWAIHARNEGEIIAERALACASAYIQDCVAAKVYNAVARLQKNPRGRRSIELLERSLALARRFDDRPLQAEVLRHLGEAMLNYDHRASAPFLEESLQICREINDAEQEGWTIRTLGELAWINGDLDQAQRLHQYSLESFERSGNMFGQTNALSSLAMLAELRGELAAAEAYLARALESMSRFGAQASASLLFDSGRLAYQREEYHRALELLRACYDQAIETNEPHFALSALIWQAICHLELGDLVAIAPLCRQVTRTALNIENTFYFGHIAIILANVVVTHGDYSSAVRLLSSLDAVYAPKGLRFERVAPVWTRLHDRALAACHTALAPESFDAAWTAGQLLTLTEIVAAVLDERR